MSDDKIIKGKFPVPRPSRGGASLDARVQASAIIARLAMYSFSGEAPSVNLMLLDLMYAAKAQSVPLVMLQQAIAAAWKAHEAEEDQK